MFSPDPVQDHVPATPDTVVALIESINQPIVQAPGHAAQPARAWVIGTRTTGSGLGLHIYLQLLENEAPVLYRWQGGPISIDAWPEAELEALSFVESLGFIVDNLGFRNLTLDRRRELLDRLPCFHPTSAPRSSGASAPAPAPAREAAGAPAPARPRPSLDPSRAARLGRVLGSF